VANVLSVLAADDTGAPKPDPFAERSIEKAVRQGVAEAVV
jgi:hypothetical protein